MNWRSSPPKKRLQMLSAGVLAVGLAAALVVYLTAPAESVDPLGDPSDSKMYLHDLELYGGKTNVLEDEFRRWWEGLWHGRQLAGTLAFLSVASAGTLAFLAAQLRPPAAARPADGGLKLVRGGEASPAETTRDERDEA